MAFWNKEKPKAQTIAEPDPTPVEATPTVPEAQFRYQREWNLTREEKLRNQLQHIRENRKKLSRIAYNCQKAADRRIYNKDYLAKAEHFRSLWYQKLSEEKEMKACIRELKQTRKEQERLHWARDRER